jgi:flagellar basal body-associated protein FliL
MEEKKPKSLFESIKKIIILLYISIMILTTAGILSGWFFFKNKRKGLL